MGRRNDHLEVPRTYQEELLSVLVGTWEVECISRDFAMCSTTHKGKRGDGGDGGDGSGCLTPTGKSGG